MTTGSTRSRTDYRRAPVSGANALQIGYADPLIDDPATTESYPGKPARSNEPARSGEPVRSSEPGQPGRPDSGERRSQAGRRSRVAPVAPPAPMALPRAPFLMLVIGLVIAGVLGVLVLNTKINENSFELDDLRSQQQDLNLQEQQLSQQLELAQSPGSLRAAAKRLGLVPAGTPAYIILPDGKIVDVPTPATGTNTTSGR
jgi:outer membrane murein-binding lipoprotein Lpp